MLSIVSFNRLFQSITVFAIVIMFMFRYVVSFIVWLVLVGAIATCFIGTIVLWLVFFLNLRAWQDERATHKEVSLIFPIEIPNRVVYSSEKRMDYTDAIGQRRTNSFLAFAIIATIVTIIIGLVVLVLRKRIQLVIALFKEAGKALGNMPLLLLEPILVIDQTLDSTFHL